MAAAKGRQRAASQHFGMLALITVCCLSVLLGLSGCVKETSEPEGLAETVTKAVVPGVGEVKVGGTVRHRQLGSGRITEIAVVGQAVTASIVFRGGKRPMLIDPEYFYPQKRAPGN